MGVQWSAMIFRWLNARTQPPSKSSRAVQEPGRWCKSSRRFVSQTRCRSRRSHVHQGASPHKQLPHSICMQRICTCYRIVPCTNFHKAVNFHVTALSQKPVTNRYSFVRGHTRFRGQCRVHIALLRHSHLLLSMSIVTPPAACCLRHSLFNTGVQCYLNKYSIMHLFSAMWLRHNLLVPPPCPICIIPQG
jgi:hypothetical protein